MRTGAGQAVCPLYFFLSFTSVTLFLFIDTKQRNRLSPDTFEALQILKSAYRNGHISATAEADKYYQTIINTLGGEEDASEGKVLEIL